LNGLPEIEQHHVQHQLLLEVCFLAMLQTSFDVIVVGGGPAGLCAAERIARAGLSVVILEKNDAIGQPVRTSGGSWIASMQELGVPERLYHPIHRLRFVGPKTEAVFDYDDALACVLDVRGLYQHLAERAVLEGAIVRVRARVEEPILEAGRVAGVRVQDAVHGRLELLGRVVVDASGHAGLIAHRLGLHPGVRSSGVGVEYDLYAPEYDSREAVLLVGSNVAPRGYAWAFPYGKHRVRLGVGVTRPHSDADPREFLEGLMTRVRGLGGANPIEYHAGLYPVLEPLSVPFVSDGLVIVGDAAGQGSNLVGEGIRFAMRSGQLAGEAVVQALEKNDVSKHGLSGYERAWKREFERPLRIAHAMHKRITAYDDEAWEARMPILRGLKPALVAAFLKGDFNARMAVDLASSHVHLAGTVARMIFPGLGVKVSARN
jgi:digeranylgeranylglycerophospholipid reductase